MTKTRYYRKSQFSIEVGIAPNSKDTDNVAYDVENKCNAIIMQGKQIPSSKFTISKIEENNTPKPKKPKVELPQKKSKYPIHTVRKGDTLYAISRKYSVTVDEIKKWNDLKTNTLEVGQELIIKKE